MTGKRVLILDGYARQTLPIVEGFKEIGCEVTVAYFSKLDVGYASKYPDHRYKFECKKNDYETQYEIAKKLIESKAYDIVVPMTDFSALYLSKNKTYLSQFTYVAVNDYPIFDLAINKLNTMRICQEKGIGAPKTLFSKEPLSDIENSGLKFPVVIKPKTGCGSIGFSIIHSVAHLKSVLENYDNSNGELLIQEYIPQDGAQYGARVFRDRDGNYSSLIIDKKPRWFPLDGGSPTINITVHDQEIEEMSRKLLDAMNWSGYANIDLAIDSRDKKPKVLEVNARVSAATKLDFCVGVNVSKLIYENAFEEHVTQHEDYPDEIKVSCLLTEILWFLKSKDRFHQRPSFLNRKNTKDVIFSMRDPLPFFSFCIQSVMNYTTEMKKRERK